MLDLRRDIHSLTDFKRKTSAFLKRIKDTGHPLVLTINGRAELVVLGAESYQRILEQLDRAEAVVAIRRGMEEFERGEGRPAREALEDLRKMHGVSR
jgi:prevent-host-death family protein